MNTLQTKILEMLSTRPGRELSAKGLALFITGDSLSEDQNRIAHECAELLETGLLAVRVVDCTTYSVTYFSASNPLIG